MFAHASMNRIYRLVWSDALGTWIAVAEHTRGRGKRSGKLLAPALAALGLAISAHAASPPAATALPTGGKVVAGSATIAQNGSTMTVNQTSGRGAIDWQTFNLGSQASLQFIQPSANSVTLNRVLDTQGSQIMGKISANGQVFLTNPNGVYFGASASVDVGGLVATTHAISDADFMAGGSTFTRDGATGAVVNEGHLNAGLGGYIALLAPEVRNSGVIVAQAGTVALAAGEAISLQFDGNNTLASLAVSPATIAALVENRQAVLAPGGRIILSAQAVNRLQGGVVNNSGSLEASGLRSDGGHIVLEASDRIDDSGSIRADGAVGGQGGQVRLVADLANPDSLTSVSGDISARGAGAGAGGFVETSGAHLKVADGVRIDVGADAGAKGGTWLLDPDGVTIAASGGDISGATLSAALTGGDVAIASTSGGGSDGNVNVNDAVSWSANKLTLTATNDVNVNAVMSASGSASLDLEPTAGRVNTKLGTNNDFTGRVDFSGSGVLTIQNHVYTVINSLGTDRNDMTVGTLQGVQASQNGYYALGSDIDASPTASWNSSGQLGMTSLAISWGAFDGLGHRILAPSIVNQSALFFSIYGDNTVSLRNLGVVGGSVSGAMYVGGLVGYNYGTISNSFSTMSVTGFQYVGGLVGENRGGILTNTYATGDVTGNVYVGGLVGRAFGNGGIVEDSYASGAVTGTSSAAFIGGLVGMNYNNTIQRSYASGNVIGNQTVGGLVGLNQAVGGTGSNIVDTYATGTVNGNTNVGGLVGENGSNISNSYAVGAVTINNGNTSVGGLVGVISTGTGVPAPITNSFWDTQTTGQATSVGGGTGLSTAQMKTRATFTGAGWDFTSPVWQLKANANNGYPCLAVFASCPAAISLSVHVNGSQASNVYGDPIGSFTYSLYNGSTLLDASGLAALGLSVSGSVSYGNAPVAGSSAGNYAVSYASGLNLGGANADNYQLSPYAGFSYTVLKRPLTVTGTRSYDGSTAFGVASLSATNLVGSDCAGGLAACSVTGSTSVTSKNVSAGTQALSFGTLSLTGSGLDADYTLVGASGTGTITPRSVTPVVSATSRAYDATTTAQASLGVGAALVSGDTLTLGFTGAAFGDKNAGNAKTVTVSGITLGGADAGNYALVSSSAMGEANITPLPLAVTASGTSRAYDGSVNDAAVLSFGSGVLAGDNVTASASASFADKNVGTAKTVSVSNIVLGGADAQNYVASNTTATTSADITPRLLQVTATGNSRVYDGTTNAGVNLAGTNQVAGDVLVLTAASAAVADKNVGVGKAVSVTGITLGGADAGNYALAGTTATTAINVTPRLVMIDASASDRVYDGGVGATVTLAPGEGFVSGDSLSANAGSAVFADKNVGTAKGVSISGITLGGSDALNYFLESSHARASASITPRALTVAGSGVDRTYDGTTGAQVSLTDNRIGGDTLSVSYAPLAFADKNAGVGKALTVSGLMLGGADAGNYTLTNTGFATSATITPRVLNLSASADDRSYDGSTAATVTLTDNQLDGDAITVSASGSFADKNVGMGKLVNVGNVVIGGADAANYVAQTGVTAHASIAPRMVTVNATAAGKVYDGTTAAQVGLSLGDSVVAGDQVAAAAASANFADKNAGVAKAVSVNGIALSGGDAANYELETNTARASATIAQRGLTVTLGAANRVYDGTTAVQTSLGDNRVAGDVLTVSSGLAAFADKNAGVGKAVQVGGIAIAGTDAANYVLNATTASTSATITPRALTVGAQGTDRTYDGSTAVGVTLTDNRVAGDALTLSGQGNMADKSAGNAKAVSVTGISASGADAGNYLVASTGSTSVNIAPRDLLVSASAADRVYDGSTKATVSFSDNRVAGDSLTVASSGAAFADALPGEGKLVNVSGLTLNGADAGDYRLVNTSLSATADIAVNTQDTVPRLPEVAVTAPAATRIASPLNLLTLSESPPVQAATASLHPPVEDTTGITVTLVRAAAGNAAGMIAVDVPKQILSKGQSFSFPLPQTVSDALAVGGASAHVSRPDATPLPGWLKYDATSHTFDVSAAPPNALPFEVKIVVDGRSWTMVLSQGSGS